MRWAKRSNYHVISDCGRYRIAVCYDRDGKMYLLSCGDQSLGWYESNQAAKRAAERHKGAA